MPPTSNCQIVKGIASKKMVWIEDNTFSETLFCIYEITFEKVGCTKVENEYLLVSRRDVFLFFFTQESLSKYDCLIEIVFQTMQEQIIVFLVDNCIICIFFLQNLNDCLKSILSVLIQFQMHLIRYHFLQNLQVISTLTLSCFCNKFDSSPKKLLGYTKLSFAIKLQALFIFFS